jgi:hypothetical protein
MLRVYASWKEIVNYIHAKSVPVFIYIRNYRIALALVSGTEKVKPTGYGQQKDQQLIAEICRKVSDKLHNG